MSDVRSGIAALPDPDDRDFYLQATADLAESAGRLLDDAILTRAIDEIRHQGGDSDEAVLWTINDRLSVHALTDLGAVSRDFELRALDLLDRVIAEADGASVRQRPITQLVFDTLAAAEFAGAPAVPTLRLISRTSHLLALEAVALREPLDPVSGLLSRPLRDILGDFRLRPDRLIPPPDTDPPVLTDQEFIEEALRRAQLADIVNAIMEGRGRFWPCRPATYSLLRAVPGEEITITTDDGDWPDTPAEVRFPTASGGTVGAAAVRTGDRLRAIVPDTAVSGEAVIYFDPEDGADDEDPFSRTRIVPPRARRGRRFCFDFFGGLSGFRDLTVSPPGDQRCWGPHDLVEIQWVSSNLMEIAAFVDGERVGRGDLATNTMAFLAPERTDFETVEIEISASGPAPPAPDPYRLRQVIEIPTMPSDRVEPTPPGVLRPTARVRNFYHFEGKTQRLPVFRPLTLAELRATIRQAEADGLTLGVKSTGGSFEDITFSESSFAPNAGSSSGLIDLAGLVFDNFGHPAIVAPPPSDAFRDAYERFLGDIANHVQLTRRVFATQLRAESTLPLRSRSPETGLLSVIGDSALEGFERATGIEPGPVRNRLVYIDAATKVWDANRVLARLGLALPTMGASGFQSLAGVISTGTHGSTFHLPPIADFVRAIHLIGAGGTEWWIEPAGRYGITTPEHLSGQPVANEHWLRRTDDHPVDRPIVDDRRCCNFVADTELFEDALVSFGSSGAVVGYVIETINAHRMRSHRIDAEPWSACRERINAFVSSPTNADVPGFENLKDTDELWFFAPTVSSFGLAWTDYRFLTSGPERDRVIGTSPLTDVADFLGTVGAGLTGSLLGIDVFDPFNDIVPTINGWFREGRLDFADAVHGLIINQIIGDTPDGFEARPSDVALAGRDFTFENWDEKVESLGDSMEADLEKFRRGASSHEFCIAASRVTDFVDDLLTFADVARREANADISPPGGSSAIRAVVFNANIRFTAQTRATMGMQKWPLTAHVEIFTHPDLTGAASLYEELERLAGIYGAIPHWGQKHEAHAYPSLYPLWSRWLHSMERLASAQGGTRKTFGSAFARDLGLYPPRP